MHFTYHSCNSGMHLHRYFIRYCMLCYGILCYCYCMSCCVTVTVCHVVLCCVTVTVCYFTCTSTPTIYVVLQCMFVFSTKNQKHAELNHVLKYVRTIYFILVLLYVMSCSTPVIYVVLQVWCSAPSFRRRRSKTSA